MCECLDYEDGDRYQCPVCADMSREADAALAAAREEVERLRVERDRFHGLATHYDDVLRQAADALIVEREPDGSPCTAGKSPVLWVLHGLDTIRSAASADARIAELEAENKYLSEHHDATHDPAGRYRLLLDRLRGEPTDHGDCPVATHLTELEAVVGRLRDMRVGPDRRAQLRQELNSPAALALGSLTLGALQQLLADVEAAAQAAQRGEG